MLAFSGAFCYNPHWTWRWVVQEVALARDVLIMQDKTRLPWGVLCDIWSTLGRLQHFESSISPECDRYLKTVRGSISSTLPFVAQQLIALNDSEKRLLEQDYRAGDFGEDDEETVLPSSTSLILKYGCPGTIFPAKPNADVWAWYRF